MPYVSRNATGELESLHRHATETASEFLADSDPEVMAFLGTEPDSLAFSRLDADFVRVIEDLVDVLLSKNILEHHRPSRRGTDQVVCPQELPGKGRQELPASV